MVRKELVSVLVLLLFVAVAHAQDSKGAGPSSSEKDERVFFKKKSRAAKTEAGRERLQLTPEEREERRKASALYAALVEPRTPKEIAFPLSEEDAAKFHASREGLMESVRVDARNYDLSDDKVRKELRDKTTANQEAVRKLLVEAVNKGATLLQVTYAMLTIARAVSSADVTGTGAFDITISYMQTYRHIHISTYMDNIDV